MLSTNTMNETTTLLDKESTSRSFCKKVCLVVFAVVCGLAIVFAILMTKWYLISQSVITPTVSHSNVEFYPNAQAPRDAQINEDAPPRSHDHDEQQGEEHDDGGGNGGGGFGATAVQLGKAFPLTILAQIAWKDLSNMLIFDGSGDHKEHDLAQSVSMIPVYISEQDCIYAVNYFEEKLSLKKRATGGVSSSEKDCQYVDLNEFKCEENDELPIGSRMLKITSQIINYFYENYSNYLIDCEINDIRMIKYLSNGTRYSGLHAETHYIDGKRIIINGIDDEIETPAQQQVDYVGIVFLNDNFDGGNLQFISPKSIDSIKPVIGNGVLFGGGLDYSHRVTPVTNGHRYVLKIIFNKN